MFPTDYFPPSFFTEEYFPESDEGAPGTGDGGPYFAPTYFAPTYFAPTYFAGEISDDVEIPDPPLFEIELQAFLEDRLDQVVHLGLIPQDFEPPDGGSAVALTVVGSETPLKLSGPAGATYWRIQLDCYAANPAWAARTTEAIRRILQPHRGPMGRCFLKGAVLLTRPGGFDARGQGRDDGTFRRTSEWRLCVRESIPSLN